MARFRTIGWRPSLQGLLRIGLTGAISCAFAVEVWACAGEVLLPLWGLAASKFDGAGRAAISPGNDTRINLLFLMRSLRPVDDQTNADPKPKADAPQLGRTFFTWDGLRDAIAPRPDKDLETASASPSACAPPAGAAGAFSAALASENLPPAERAALIGLRAKVGCGAVDWRAPIASARGREYLAYLQASAAFYDQKWRAAADGFAVLAHARSPWIAETAAYMPIRIALRQALAGAVDAYGDFSGKEHADAGAVAAARAAIAAYLKAWPNGRYAASASGLVRRVLWLEGDSVNLARAYERLLAMTPPDREEAVALAEEIDLKLLSEETSSEVIRRAGDTPLLLAVDDVRGMRAGEAPGAMALSAADLAGQASVFARLSRLYAFLQASRALYAGEDPHAVIPLLQDKGAKGPLTPLEFSRQVVLGMALARAKDPVEPRFWSDLIGRSSPVYQRPLAELGLAVHWQGEGRLDLIFAPGSPVDDAMTREILLQTMASASLLRAEALNAARPGHERDLARFTLFYKDLSRGAYADFVKDVTLASAASAASNGDPWLGSVATGGPAPVGLFTQGKWSDGFACGPVTETAAQLARAPADRRARLCLGDFWRLNGFDGFSLFVADKAPLTLGRGPDAFPGDTLWREAIYASVIADKRAAPDERAYALYRAVMCYAPSGVDGCAGPSIGGGAAKEASKAQRKAWFLELKKTYPESPWAKKLQYYW